MYTIIGGLFLVALPLIIDSQEVHHKVAKRAGTYSCILFVTSIMVFFQFFLKNKHIYEILWPVVWLADISVYCTQGFWLDKRQWKLFISVSFFVSIYCFCDYRIYMVNLRFWSAKFSFQNVPSFRNSYSKYLKSSFFGW